MRGRVEEKNTDDELNEAFKKFGLLEDGLKSESDHLKKKSTKKGK